MESDRFPASGYLKIQAMKKGGRRPTGQMRHNIASKLFGHHATPTQIDHFIVLRESDAGAFARAFLAYDLSFDRKVELLLCEPGIRREDIESIAEKFAQALGVSTEVGCYKEQAYIAVEAFKAAQDFPSTHDRSRWLEEQLAPWISVGEQLCAAHALGVVHGDFSPSQISCSPEGRYLISGFRYWFIRDKICKARSLSKNLSQNAAAELQSTTPLDARSDQYRFCFALWQFFREEAGPPPALGSEPLETSLKHPEAMKRVPKELSALLHTGMSTDPEKRHGSLSVVVSGLLREHRRQQRKLLLIKSLLVTLSLLAALFLRLFWPAPASCDQQMEIWDRAEHRLRAPALEKLGVVEELRGYISQGKTLHHHACNQHEESPRHEIGDFKSISACFSAAVEAVSGYQDRLVEHASNQKSRLSSPLLALPPLVACAQRHDGGLEQDSELEEVERTLAKARLQAAFHEFPSSLALADKALTLLQSPLDSPQRIRALLLKARALNALGEIQKARTHVDLAYIRSEYQNDLSLRLQAAVLRSKIIRNQGHFSASMAALRDAWPLAQKAEVSVEAKLEFLSKACLVDRRDMKRCETLDFCQRAAKLIEQHGLSELSQSEIDRRMAWIYYEVGRIEDAVELANQARRRVKHYTHEGSNLVLAADALYVSLMAELLRKTEATAADHTALAAESQRLFERHLQVYGPKSYLVSIAWTNWAEITRRAGQLSQAKTIYEQQLAAFPDDSNRYFALTGYGKVLLGLGERSKAIEVLEQALHDILDEIEQSRQSGGNPQIPEYPEALLALSRALGPSQEGLDAARRASTLYYELQDNLERDANNCPELGNPQGMYQQEIAAADRWLASSLARMKSPDRRIHKDGETKAP